MNREIKFRAFDTERKMFVPSGEIIFSDYGDTNISVQPNCLQYIGDKCNNGEPQKGRFIICQYTGLKDKNCKEIYEGDLINNRGIICAVIWQFYSCEWLLQQQQTGKSYMSFDYQIAKSDCEVIGNIYENP